jgi:hypothetical protein
MRLGLCSKLSRLWIRLVTKTVLPERLSPVTARETVAPPLNSLTVPASRSDASAKTGGSQLKFIMGPAAAFTIVDACTGGFQTRPLCMR